MTAATRKAQYDLGALTSTVACRCPIDLRSRYYVHDSLEGEEMAYHVGVAEITGRVKIPDPQDPNSIEIDDLWELARFVRRNWSPAPIRTCSCRRNWRQLG